MENGSNTTTTSLEIGDNVIWRDENGKLRLGEVYMTDDFKTTSRYVVAKSKDNKPEIKLGTTSADQIFYKATFLSHEWDYMKDA